MTGGFTTYYDLGNDASAIEAAIRRSEQWRGHSTIVLVKAVNPGNGFVGTVDVQPMVHQVDGAGNPTPHGTIHGIPYLRIQGGASAVIIDPAVGDIGFITVAGRDISNVIANRAPSPPGSYRMHDMADAVYVGGYLNAAPTQFIQFTADGITISTPGKLVIKASEVDIQSTVKATGDVVAGSVSLESHTHGNVENGEGTTGEPEK